MARNQRILPNIPQQLFSKTIGALMKSEAIFLAIFRWHFMKATLQRARKTSLNCACHIQNKAKRWINVRWKFISHPYRRSFHKLGISLTCSARSWFSRMRAALVQASLPGRKCRHSNISKLVRALWLVNLAARALLHGPLNWKFFFVAKPVMESQMV